MIRTDEGLNQTREALRLLEESLASQVRSMPSLHPDRLGMVTDPVVYDIRKLRAEIDDFIGLTAAVFARADVWLRFEGPGIEPDYIPSRILTALVDTLRAGVQATAEFLHQEANGARPAAQLARACDLRLVGWIPGKVQIGLLLPEGIASANEETSIYSQARRALAVYLQAASWVGSEETVDSLEEAFPDLPLRRLVSHQVARLVPGPESGVDLVELAGKGLNRGPALLRPKSQERIHAALAEAAEAARDHAEGVLTRKGS
jgi:hypothetical protein